MFINKTKALKSEIEESLKLRKGEVLRHYYYGKAYSENMTDSVPVMRAKGFKYYLENLNQNFLENEYFLGLGGNMFLPSPEKNEREYYERFSISFGGPGWKDGEWWQHRDHYAPAYERIINMGIGGIIKEIEESKNSHKNDISKLDFLEACKIEMLAFSDFIKRYAEKCSDPVKKENCLSIVWDAPKTFYAGLQLIWFCHMAFIYKGCGAMAFGRIDQYLKDLYINDIKNGVITFEEAKNLLENFFMKITEFHSIYNICIGGITAEGEDAVNDLSYAVLWAVKACQVPGPNLSARISEKNPDKFLKECLKSIGTGLGYPALMCDETNRKALMRMGYEEKDVNNFCFVGCIENLIPGMQPPWADGRYNAPLALGYTLFDGVDVLTGKKASIKTGDAEKFSSMDEFMSALERQLKAYADVYILEAISQSGKYDKYNHSNAFMSCLTHNCIERGLDINNGGTKYKSAYGACGMGIGTIADSLAAIEKCVYTDKSISMATLKKAIENNFAGFEKERELLKNAPKFGNDDDFADKYAVWYVEYLSKMFDEYRLSDGGRVYVLMAANTQNVSAGYDCAATPDGRLAREPLSDAGSPTYGVDVNGPTYTFASLAKPDYTKIAGGSVVNQKFSPSMFEGEANINRLCTLVRVYFGKGGQELQINSVSREVLKDAMVHPEKYKNLVVRVSGFSAYYITLDRAVQLDILSRTEHSA